MALASNTVEKAVLALLISLLPLAARAQTGPPTPAVPAKVPFAILDNSFLVEEAFNQEAGIFQNIFGLYRGGGGWDFAFTQEWPIGSQTHQLSYTLAALGEAGDRGFGDVMINYRFQATLDEGRLPAMSPRISVILPSGSSALTNGAPGLQFNLPISKQLGDFYFHANAGLTWFPRVEAQPDTTGTPVASLSAPHVSGSAIFRVRPMLNLMLESVLASEQSMDTNGLRSREAVFTLAPGARGGWNVGDQQIIVGVAVPIRWRAGEFSAGMFLYLSYELPFGK